MCLIIQVWQRDRLEGNRWPHAPDRELPGETAEPVVRCTGRVEIKGKCRKRSAAVFTERNGCHGYFQAALEYTLT